MKKIIKVQELVKGILENDPETRDDDNLLWAQAIREAAFINGCAYVLDWSIGSLMLNVRTLHLPTFETVSRARRKLQSKHPELRGTEKVTKARGEREKVFEEYAKNGCAV